MDPTQCYDELRAAWHRGDLETARERALDLREWLRKGGFYPAHATPAKVEETIADVLRQTKHISIS